MSDIYREELLEHYRHPQNFGKLKKYTYSADKPNPLCGDEIILQLLEDKQGKIKDAKFQGVGCVLSIASASLLTEWMKGKSRQQLARLKPEQVVKNLSIEVGPARRKCALLVYEALQEILKAQNEKRKTKNNNIKF